MQEIIIKMLTTKDEQKRFEGLKERRYEYWKLFRKKINGKGDRWSGPRKMSRFQQIDYNLDVAEVWQMECVLKNKTKKTDWDEQIGGLGCHAKFEKLLLEHLTT